MKFKYIISVFFLSLMLILAGCGEEIDCSKQDTDYKKYGLDEASDTCVIVETIRQDVCGNGIAEEGESFCNCPKDVVKDHPDYGCDGTLGDYLEKTCSEKNECVLTQNKKVADETKSLQIKNRDIIFETKVTLPKPFILTGDKDSEIKVDEDNKIDIDISYFNIIPENTNIVDLTIKEIKIENTGSVILGNLDVNEKLSKVGDKLDTKSISLSSTNEYKKIENVIVKFEISYTKETLNKDGSLYKSEFIPTSLTLGLGKFEIINPDLYEN